jgi:predicted transcriptional regulator
MGTDSSRRYEDPYLSELGDNFTVEGMQKVKRFVRAVKAYDGEAHTTQIREESGLSRSSYQHFYEKLTEVGIMENDITRANGTIMKVARLTRKGDEMYRKKAFDRWLEAEQSPKTPAPVQYDETIEALETRVNALEQVVEELQAERDSS